MPPVTTSFSSSKKRIIRIKVKITTRSRKPPLKNVDHCNGSVTAGKEGRAGTPLPAAARTECAPYQPSLTDYESFSGFRKTARAPACNVAAPSRRCASRIRELPRRQICLQSSPCLVRFPASWDDWLMKTARASAEGHSHAFRIFSLYSKQVRNARFQKLQSRSRSFISPGHDVTRRRRIFGLAMLRASIFPAIE